MKAHLAKRKRCVGRTDAATAGVTVGRNSPSSSLSVASDEAPPAREGVAQLGEMAPGALAFVGDAPSSFEERANAGPASRRSKASSPGDLGGAPCAAPP